MKKIIYFIPVGGFHAIESPYPTLKETMERMGYKRSEISEWWKQPKEKYNYI